LHTRFYLCIENNVEKYEPEYKCSECKKVLIGVNLSELEEVLFLVLLYFLYRIRTYVRINCLLLGIIIV